MSASLRDRIFEAKLRLVRPSELEELRWMERNERIDPEALAALQRERAADLVAFAIAHSDFYRERFRGLDPRELRRPAAFESLPVLERADLREHRERIRTDEATASNVQHAVTGGTTGEPLRVMRDERANHRTLGWRLQCWWGVRPGENKALIWRDALPGFSHKWKHNLMWWPTRTVQMDANAIDERTTAEFLDGWERIRPAVMTGYVGAVIALAQFIERNGRTLAPPKAVGVTSAPITPGQKQYLSQVFGAPVYDHYQCIEVPMLAGECAQRDGLHVFADSRWVEIVDEDGRAVGPGEAGNVVVTDFRNRVFPLIRYRLGDVARFRKGACPCGVTFPLLEPVRGRVTDALRFPSGLVVAGEPMCAIFHPWPEAVRQFQVYQAPDYSLTLRCVRGSDPNADAIMRRVVEQVRTTVRGEVPVRLEVVEQLRHDRGKQRFIVSDAPAPQPARSA
jgi:phenylacetate-CoA ligase